MRNMIEVAEHVKRGGSCYMMPLISGIAPSRFHPSQKLSVFEKRSFPAGFSKPADFSAQNLCAKSLEFCTLAQCLVWARFNLSAESGQFLQRRLEVGEPLFTKLALPVSFELAHGGNVRFENQPSTLGEVNSRVSVPLFAGGGVADSQAFRVDRRDGSPPASDAPRRGALICCQSAVRSAGNLQHIEKGRRRYPRDRVRPRPPAGENAPLGGPGAAERRHTECSQCREFA